MFFATEQTNEKKIQKSRQANAPEQRKQWTDEQRQTEHQLITAPTKNGSSVIKPVCWQRNRQLLVAANR